MKLTPLRALISLEEIFLPSGMNSIIRRILKILNDLKMVNPANISRSLINRTPILGTEKRME
jgi:hypothetical protein